MKIFISLLILIFFSVLNLYLPSRSVIHFFVGYSFFVLISLFISYKISSFKISFLGTVLFFLISFFSKSLNLVFVSSFPFFNLLIFYFFCRFSINKYQREYVNLLSPAAMLESETHIIDIVYSLFMTLITIILFLILMTCKVII